MERGNRVPGCLGARLGWHCECVPSKVPRLGSVPRCRLELELELHLHLRCRLEWSTLSLLLPVCSIIEVAQASLAREDP